MEYRAYMARIADQNTTDLLRYNVFFQPSYSQIFVHTFTFLVSDSTYTCSTLLLGPQSSKGVTTIKASIRVNRSYLNR